MYHKYLEIVSFLEKTLYLMKRIKSQKKSRTAMMTSFLLIPFCMILCRIDFPQMKIRMRKMVLAR